MKIVVSEKSYRKFAFEVFKYLYANHYLEFMNMIGIDHSRPNARPFVDYGNGQIKGAFVEKSSNALADKHNEPSYTFHFFDNDWLFEGSWRSQRNNTTNNQCITALIELINIKFSQYKILSIEGTSYMLVKKPMERYASLTNLIRTEYAYSSPTIMNFEYFFQTSTILTSFGNLSFLALMDRVPVYVVDGQFMKDNFDRNDNIWEVFRILKAILKVLEEILDILQENEDAEDLPAKIGDAKTLPRKLCNNIKYKDLISKIERFLSSIEGWSHEYGVHATIRNNNFASWLQGIIKEIQLPQMSTECLGVYCPDWKKNGFHEKAIFICWERILECADHGQAINLLTKVTIHEFCHAYMDVVAGSGRANKDVYHWMEESMANVLTLKVMENYAIKHSSAIQLFKYAKSFMLKQPDAYASAVRMWENGICDYDLWAWNKDKCVAAISINNWYNEMSASWKTIKNDRIRELWSKVRQEILGIV